MMIMPSTWILEVSMFRGWNDAFEEHWTGILPHRGVKLKAKLSFADPAQSHDEHVK